MRERANICKYLDMPVQHVSDRMLESMRRGTTKAKTEALISTIRDKVPGVALRTTLIAGYPGETKADHAEAVEWIRKIRFDRLGVFPYSHEENTHAFGLKDDVSAPEKKRRCEALMDAQRDVSLSLNQAKVGRTFKVLVDSKEGSQFVGRTEHDSPEVDNSVLVDAKKHYLRIGDFADVKVTSADDFDLHGVPA
jgi:ribosomal protein S12 methylthiotransferase